MRSLVYVAAIGALMAAGSADAAVKPGFTGETGSSLSWVDSTRTGQDATFPNGGYVVSAAPILKPNGKPKLDKNGDPQMANYGGSLQADVKVKKHTASFISGVAARGGAAINEGETSGASASSTTGVDATITNNGASAIRLNSIDSDIIQAGMGFMVQKTTGAAAGSNVFTGYGVDPKGSFADINVGGALNGQIVATSGFTFNIYGAAYANTPDAIPLYTLSGWVSLGFDANGNVFETSNVTDAEGLLNNFSLIYPDDNGLTNDDNIFGYEWDETGITVALDQVLQANQSTTLYYRATSYVDISAPCPSNKECLVAYSGFGDPVGRGGGVSDFAALSLRSNARSSDPCPNDSSEICFSPQSVSPFSNVEFTRGVPEPASWALMIVGFGLSGAALRRRRMLSYS